jgi:hypothetical protein
MSKMSSVIRGKLVTYLKKVTVGGGWVGEIEGIMDPRNSAPVLVTSRRQKAKEGDACCIFTINDHTCGLQRIKRLNS